MPIKSFLVFPHSGKETMLFNTLASQNNCEVFPAENMSVFVLVTDTPSDQDDEVLLRNLQAEENLHHINFISGFITEPYEQGRV